MTIKIIRLEIKTGAVATTLFVCGGVYFDIFVLRPMSFFLSQIQIDQFEKRLIGQNMNIHPQLTFYLWP